MPISGSEGPSAPRRATARALDLGRRRKAREFALQLLYQLDVRGDADPGPGIDEFWRRHPVDSDEVRNFADAPRARHQGAPAEIDELIAQFAEHWELDRMAVVDRNILRAGIWELLWGVDVPPKVAINEALEIARSSGPRSRAASSTGSSTGYGGSSARSAVVVTGLDPVASGDGPAERWRRLAVAAVAGAAMHLAFPRPGWDLLGWVALAPVLALAATARTPGRAFLEGWVAGLAFFLLLMRWLTHTMTTFSTMPMPVAVLVVVAMAAYLGLFWGGVAWAVAWLGRRMGPRALWLAPALWVTGELLRTYLLSGFPWGLLGYVPSRRLLVIQIAAWTGVYGVSALLVLVNTALAWAAVERRGRATAGALVVAGVAVAGALLVGRAHLAPIDAPAVPVAVVQGNIPQDVKWDAGVQGGDPVHLRRAHPRRRAGEPARRVAGGRDARLRPLRAGRAALADRSRGRRAGPAPGGRARCGDRREAGELPEQRVPRGVGGRARHAMIRCTSCRSGSTCP